MSVESDLAVIARRLDDMEKARANARGELNERLDDILEEAKTTNGRVRKLELWRAGLVGAGSVLLLVQPVVTALLIDRFT